jgi:predicted CXXCH cytochrome family protein
MRCVFVVIVLGAAACWAAVPLAPQASIIASPHNLSTMGPGAIRAAGEQEVCIFCHTPHNSTSIQPLWNRTLPVSQYQVYTSNSLKAKPGQPTGSSKLCLSCHDGTIAVGSVHSRNQPIMMAGGITTLLPGKGNLGTDLRDDHPVSFRFDTELVGKNPKLKSPLALPTGVHLDKNQELQCTSCHDAHNNSRGKFMVVDNTASQLCNSCHLIGQHQCGQPRELLGLSPAAQRA